MPHRKRSGSCAVDGNNTLLPGWVAGAGKTFQMIAAEVTETAGTLTEESFYACAKPSDRQAVISAVSIRDKYPGGNEEKTLSRQTENGSVPLRQGIMMRIIGHTQFEKTH